MDAYMYVYVYMYVYTYAYIYVYVSVCVAYPVGLIWTIRPLRAALRVPGNDVQIRVFFAGMGSVDGSLA